MVRDRVPGLVPEERDPELLHRGPRAVDDLPDDHADQRDRAERGRRRSTTRATSPKRSPGAGAPERGHGARGRSLHRREHCRAAARHPVHRIDTRSFTRCRPRPGACANSPETRQRCAPMRRRVAPRARRTSRAGRRRARSSSTSTISPSPTARRPRVSGVSLDIYRQPGHRRDRPVRLRQEHVHPLPEPDERPRARAQRSAEACSTTGSTSTAAASTRSRCGGGSGWCSSGRIRSRNRSTTTSPWPRNRSG